MMMLVCAFVAFGAVAQSGAFGRLCYPEQMRADVEMLRSTIHQAHPDPYRYHTRMELDRIIDSAEARMNIPMPVESFMSELMPVFHAVGDAHTRVELPLPCITELATSMPLLPLRVSIIDGGLYVKEEQKGFRSLPQGSRIRGINGRSSEAIIATLLEHIPGDGSDTTYRRRMVEQDFSVLYVTFIEQARSFDIQYEAPDGTLAQQKVFALTGDEMQRSLTAAKPIVAPWYVTRSPDIGTTWVTLSTLDKEVLNRSGVKPERFIHDLLDDLVKDGTTTLVLDVRGAGGSDLVMAEQVFSMVAQEPYRVIQGMSVRSMQAPEFYKYAAPQEEFYASAGDNYLPDRSGMYMLRPGDPRLDQLKPLGNAFAGKVYVVQDGLTREAGAAFVLMAHRSERARTVGEECGANAFSFCGGRELQITAPGTGVLFHIPLIRYVPDGAPNGPMDRGELPDHPVQPVPSILAQGHDSVRDALLMLIREMR